MTVSWIGLGKLGLPMAGRLVAGGFAVVAYDRSPERLALAKQRSVKIGTDFAQEAAGSRFVVSSLPDDGALQAVFGDGGMLGSMAKGSTLIETSTVSPAASAALASLCEQQGIAYLRCPLSGGPTLAEAGTLTALASGPRVAFDEALPLLACFSKSQRYLGHADEARYAKLALNLMVATTAGMMAESLSLARAGNIGWNDMLDLLDESAVASPVVRYKVSPLKQRDFSSTFSGKQMLKDLELVVGAAEASNVVTPIARLVRSSFSALVEEGLGDEDFIAIVKSIERRSGLAEPARV